MSDYRVLVTGANGFIGQHVCAGLQRKGYQVFPFDRDHTEEQLSSYINQADFIIHLAGVNRPLSSDEFYKGNADFTKHLIGLILEKKRVLPIVFASSIQATLDNDYGKSKKIAEDSLFASSLPVYVYRLANVFGRGCRPNYNSAAATFCYNIAHDLPIEIRDPNCVIHYHYVEDVVSEFVRIVDSYRLGAEVPASKEPLSLAPVYDCALGRLAELLHSFKDAIESPSHLPLIHGEFERKLFKTFCGYFSEEGHSFNRSEDARGSFEEIFKSKKWGQISENIAFPGITKGGHYHTHKEEVFMTVKGHCVIRQRNIKTGELLVDEVFGDNPKPFAIHPGYTHEIENVGDEDSLTLMWISEIYDPATADTYVKEVRP